MKNFKNAAIAFVSDESGQDLVEYSLVAALLSAAAVATLKSLATAINGVFGSITSTLTSAV